MRISVTLLMDAVLFVGGFCRHLTFRDQGLPPLPTKNHVGKQIIASVRIDACHPRSSGALEMREGLFRTLVDATDPFCASLYISFELESAALF